MGICGKDVETANKGNAEKILQQQILPQKKHQGWHPLSPWAMEG